MLSHGNLGKQAFGCSRNFGCTPHRKHWHRAACGSSFLKETRKNVPESIEEARHAHYWAGDISQGGRHMNTESRTCPCGSAFIPKRKDQRFHDPKCRWNAANERKGAQRKAALEENGHRCSVEGCGGKARFYYENTGDTLCGEHHAVLYRLSKSGEIGVLIGRYHHGFFHVSLYDPGIEAKRYHDGGISQLIDHLSGETDALGELIPHPLKWNREAQGLAIAA